MPVWYQLPGAVLWVTPGVMCRHRERFPSRRLDSCWPLGVTFSAVE